MGCLFSRFSPNSHFPGQSFRVFEVAEALGYTRSDVNAMYRYFCSLDVSNEGLVSTREFVVVNKISCEKYGEMIFQVFDKNNSGNVTFERFIVAMWNILSFEEKDLATFAFGVFDKDHSGRLSPGEVKEIVEIAWGDGSSSNPRVANALKRFDQNNDGDVTLREFLNVIKEFPILLFPVFQMQILLRDKSLGESRWKRICEYRKNKFNDMTIFDIMSKWEKTSGPLQRLAMGIEEEDRDVKHRVKLDGAAAAAGANGSSNNHHTNPNHSHNHNNSNSNKVVADNEHGDEIPKEQGQGRGGRATATATGGCAGKSSPGGGGRRRRSLDDKHAGGASRNSSAATSRRSSVGSPSKIHVDINKFSSSPTADGRRPRSSVGSTVAAGATAATAVSGGRRSRPPSAVATNAGASDDAHNASHTNNITSAPSSPTMADHHHRRFSSPRTSIIAAGGGDKDKLVKVPSRDKKLKIRIDEIDRMVLGDSLDVPSSSSDDDDDDMTDGNYNDDHDHYHGSYGNSDQREQQRGSPKKGRSDRGRRRSSGNDGNNKGRRRSSGDDGNNEQSGHRHTRKSSAAASADNGATAVDGGTGASDGYNRRKSGGTAGSGTHRKDKDDDVNNHDNNHRTGHGHGDSGRRRSQDAAAVAALSNHHN